MVDRLETKTTRVPARHHLLRDSRPWLLFEQKGVHTGLIQTGIASYHGARRAVPRLARPSACHISGGWHRLVAVLAASWRQTSLVLLHNEVETW